MNTYQASIERLEMEGDNTDRFQALLGILMIPKDLKLRLRKLL